jgi:hypothetical protein
MIVPLPEPPIAALVVKVKVAPTCPGAPETVDCVGGAETDVMTRLELHPEQLTACPTTKGRACAARPPGIVTVFPVHVAVADAA